MNYKRDTKERVIENYLSRYQSYKIGMRNCQKQLDYMLPTLTARYEIDGQKASFYITNNTEQVAIDRITSKKALDLLEEIEEYRLIVTSINEAMTELDEKQSKFVELRYFQGLKIYQIKDIMAYKEDKSLYRIRNQVLDKFTISLKNLLSLK
jgi:hypothetical protein